VRIALHVGRVVEADESGIEGRRMARERDCDQDERAEPDEPEGVDGAALGL
jgi:hypothetical protein